MKLSWIGGMALLAGIAAGREARSAQAIPPMAKEAHPVFEAATIRLSDPASKKDVMTVEKVERPSGN